MRELGTFNDKQAREEAFVHPQMKREGTVTVNRSKDEDRLLVMSREGQEAMRSFI